MPTEWQSQAEDPGAHLTYLCTRDIKIPDWLSQFELRLSVTCSPRHLADRFTMYLSKWPLSLLNAPTLRPDTSKPLVWASRANCVLWLHRRTAVTSPVSLIAGICVPPVTALWSGLVCTLRLGKPGLRGLRRPF